MNEIPKHDPFVENIRLIDQAYKTRRKELLRLSPEERAQRLIIPKMVWQAHTGQNTIPKDMEEEVIKRQTEYFNENPTLTLANPIIYRDLMEHHAKGSISVWGGALMRFVAIACGADKREAGNGITVKV